MPDACTSLDPLEITVPELPASPATLPALPSTDPIGWRHNGWKPVRDRIWDAFTHLTLPVPRMEAFRSCGSHPYLYESDADPGVYKLRASYCHDRWCLPCMAARARHIAAVLADLCQAQPIRMITLTLKADGDPLVSRLNRLQRAYKRLRQTPLWKQHVHASAAFLEITFSWDLNNWHTHLHVIYVGTYWPQHTLATCWLDITSDSHIVHITKIRDQAQAAHYVCKYISKPIDPDVYRDDLRLREAISALHHRRLILLTGAWRGTKLRSLPTDDGWHRAFPADTLFTMAQAGQTDAIAALTSLRTTGQCTLTKALDDALRHVGTGTPSAAFTNESPSAPSAENLYLADWHRVPRRF